MTTDTTGAAAGLTLPPSPAPRPARQRIDDAGNSRSLRVGVITPPWVEVPPPAYSGIELLIDTLARGRRALGHRVRLFTVGTSTCPVERDWLYRSPPTQIGMAIPELRHALKPSARLQGRAPAGSPTT